MSLKRKLILGFSIAIVSSLILVSLISMFIINERFQNYLEEEQAIKFKTISDEVSTLYINNNYSTSGFNFDRIATNEGIEITLLDENGNSIYTSGTPRMRGMGRGIMQRSSQSDILKTINFDIIDSGRRVGQVIIGYYNYSYITESASIFFSTLQRSIILAGIIALLIGLVISLLVSKKISDSLLHIKNTAYRITKGDLSPVNIKKTKITEVDELTGSIDYLRSELINQDRIRKEYAQNISHDLRTPLTTIKTYIEAIQDGIYEPNNDNLNLIGEEIDRVNKLVEDLKNSYNMNKEDLGLILSNYNLNQELENIKSTYESIFIKESKNLNLEINENINVTLDKSKIREAIINLLDNSRKYTSSGGNITLTAYRNKSDLIIGVIDDGVGIPSKDIPHVKNRLYRVDSSRNKSTGGSGLGLALVESIVKAHDGQVVIESDENRGTKAFMIFKIPPRE